MLLDGGSAENATAEWHQGPNTRGSFNILLSCLITLGLCIWTSVHLNLPGTNNTASFSAYKALHLDEILCRKAKWLLVGMLAPELIAYTAWWQRREALQTTKIVNDFLSNNTEASISRSHLTEHRNVESAATETANKTINRRIRKWTRVHGFYAAMGGFVFDTASLPKEDQFLPSARTRVTLTESALQFLILEAPWLLPDISATWFLVQVIYRIASGFGISLLELNTAAHALCALLIYFLWWNKPLDIKHPTIITGESANDVCAFLSFFSRLRRRPYLGLTEGSFRCRHLTGDLHWFSTADSELFTFFDEDGVENDKTSSSSPSNSPNENGSHAATPRVSESVETASGYRRIHPKQRIGNVICKAGLFDKSGRSLADFDGLKEAPRNDKGSYTPYDEHDQRRWEMAYQVRKRHPSWEIHSTWKPYLTARISNVPLSSASFSSGNESQRDISELVTMVLAGLSYGTIHILAWEYSFPNKVQRILWRSSGIIVAAYPLLAIFLLGARILIEKALANTSLQNKMASPVWFEKGATFLFLAVPITAYCFARVFLVLECFISFPYLNGTVFREPQWPSYFPHIT